MTVTKLQNERYISDQIIVETSVQEVEKQDDQLTERFFTCEGGLSKIEMFLKSVETTRYEAYSKLIGLPYFSGILEDVGFIVVSASVCSLGKYGENFLSKVNSLNTTDVWMYVLDCKSVKMLIKEKIDFILTHRKIIFTKRESDSDYSTYHLFKFLGLTEGDIRRFEGSSESYYICLNDDACVVLSKLGSKWKPLSQKLFSIFSYTCTKSNSENVSINTGDIGAKAKVGSNNV